MSPEYPEKWYYVPGISPGISLEKWYYVPGISRAVEKMQILIQILQPELDKTKKS